MAYQLRAEAPEVAPSILVDTKIDYRVLIPRLRNLVLGHYEFDSKKTLPCRSFCSDETQMVIADLLSSYFGARPFNFGRVGALLALDRSPAAAHHGKNLVIVSAAHVGYDPNASNSAEQYGRIFRPQMDCSVDDDHSHSSCCGKIVGTITPFKESYDRTSQDKLHLIKKEVGGTEKYCIVINNSRLAPFNDDKILELHLEKLLKFKNDSPVEIDREANSIIYEANPGFVEDIGEENFLADKPTPIGKNLTGKYFDFRREVIKENEDGSHLILKGLLPYMNRVVTSDIPSFEAARIVSWGEFGKAVNAFGHHTSELDLGERSIFLISGINLDYFDHEAAKINPLAGNQVYFIPMAAYVKNIDDPNHPDGQVLEREELLDLLLKQEATAERFSLDEVLELG
ncbi:hypothetical protein ACFL0W_01350 [Nanoarchaeota archaeon]